MSQTKTQLISDLIQSLNFTGITSAPANGMFLSGANTLAFATASAEKMVISSDGKVGIGTTSATAKLEIHHSNNINLRLKHASSSNHYSFGPDASGNFKIVTEDLGELIRLGSSGNIGIKTTSPDGDLHVHGSSAGSVTAASDASTLVLEDASNVGLSLLTANDKLARIRFGDADSNSRGLIAYNHVNDKLIIETSNTTALKIGTDMVSARADFAIQRAVGGYTFRESSEGTEGAGLHSDTSNNLIFKTGNESSKMKIDSSGNVGIGDLNPEGKLHIGTNTNTDGTDVDMVIGGDTANNRQFRIRKKIQSDDRAVEFFASTGSTGEEFRFYSDSSSKRLVISDAGNVGIGTANPSARLHLLRANASMLTVQSSVSGSNILVQDSGSTSIFRTVDGRLHLEADSDNQVADSEIRFIVDGSIKARIDSSGNFGLGIAPSSAFHLEKAGTNQNLLKLQADLGSNNNRTLEIKSPASDSTTASFVINTGNSYEFQVDDNAAFNIDSSGKIGIGTTSPDTPVHILANDAQLLTVQRSGANNASIRFRNDTASMFCGLTTSATGFAIDDDDNLGLSPMLFVDRSTANVGIGTSTVSDAKCVVAGNLKVTQPAGTDAQVNINEATGDNPLRLTQTATESLIQTRANQPLNIRAQSGSTSNSYLAFWTRDDERVRIAKSGQVSIGRSTDTFPNTNSTLALIGNASSVNAGGFLYLVRNQNLTEIDSGGKALGSIAFSSKDGKLGARITADSDQAWTSTSCPGRLEFYTTPSGTLGIEERMRITNEGKVLIGTTASGGQGGVSIIPSSASFAGAASAKLVFNRADDTGSSTVLEFKNNGTLVGSIAHTNTATVYNTSSDYRLKENVIDISDGITRLKTLKPSRFNFITNSETTVDGFLAHEVTAVPEAITGTKDAVDSENNPVYQEIDYSKLVPLLTAALQEAVTKIETLETKVATLEAA